MSAPFSSYRSIFIYLESTSNSQWQEILHTAAEGKI
jgi:hypothetical protein